MADAHTYIEAASREEASAMAADFILKQIENGLSQRGAASVAFSGGSTPAATYTLLSGKNADWKKVAVALVDERFVPPNNAASNQRFIERTLFKNNAAAATFHPMWSDGASLDEAAKRASENYRRLLPFDVALFGMGADAHTASWFPESKDLAAATALNAPTVLGVHAPGADGTPERLTLTKKAVEQTRQSILLLFGKEKKDVFVDAIGSDAPQAPVRILVDTLGATLTIIWAP